MARSKKDVKKKEEVRLKCIDCEHARDFHERGADGKFFLCKCDFQKWSRFLHSDSCENFKIRP